MRLRLLSCDGVSDEGLAEVAPKLPLLEELEAIGKSCPLLNSFKLNKEWCSFSDYEPYEYHFGDWYSSYYGQQQNQPFPFKNDYNGDAFAIAGTMAGLRHLQLFGNKLTDDGLRYILDSCPHLSSLDLRHCFILNFDDDPETICAERIEKLWLPHDFTEGKDFVARSESYCFKWTDLPDNVTRSILSRAGVIEILTSAEKVCSKWFKICKAPSMWCTIDMPNKVPIDDIRNYMPFSWHDVCENAIELSCGNLVDINIESFGTNFLLDSLAQRAGGLKRLRIVGSPRITDEGFREVASRFPVLEDLDLTLDNEISHKTLSLVGQSCLLLKSFKFNNKCFPENTNNPSKGCALAIARRMHGLHHLVLFGNQLTNNGLCAILDGCPHLQSLDLRHCFNLKLRGKTIRRLAEQIQKLWLPQNSLEDNDPSYRLKAEL